MSHSEIERLTAEATALVRRAIEIGVQLERARVRALLSADADPGLVGEAVAAPPSPRRARGVSSRGPIAEVRKALAEMTIGEAGIDAAELLAYLARANPSLRITEKQVRGSLKHLTITGEAIRASRGRYLPRAATTPSRAEEKPGDDTPGFFNLAAE